MILRKLISFFMLVYEKDCFNCNIALKAYI